MDDWKIRLQEEYAQLKERYEKLKAYNNKYEIEYRLGLCLTSDHAEARKKDVDDILRRDQYEAMERYLHVLELRAELHGITLDL